MQTAPELFIHELSDILDAEHNLLEALQQQAEESSRPELQKAFESHRKQTERASLQRWPSSLQLAQTSVTGALASVFAGMLS